MKKKYLFALTLAFVLKALPAKAVCPVCLVAAGAGLGLSEYLGIDDSIAGLWIGGLLIGLSAWTITYFNKKNWLKNYSAWRDPLIIIVYYLMVIWPLYSQGFIGNPFNRLYGVDKLALGITVGSIFFALAAWSYELMKKKNGGHAHFPFEKVVLPISTLVILSVIFYFLSR
ncbi:MAG TPA: hypothetical protein PLA05_02370 [bacterium]|mgnify:CR=1 FL=1|jgi:hypothetical protein|nr:MAG: hypothetical protein BWX82_00715 [Parcubacteria group bacterium ADurb.Bin115]HNU81507.1 hypothetical protein [bacterium]HOD87140.1 hypothetical protein [bacterium]HPW05788.1 hypothetical protein [bacterium]HQB76489.1 hypothetical protein [bacterium]